MLFTCIKIFLARIVDVSIGTVRTVLVVRGSRIKGAILAFFEVLIWFMIAREALNTETSSLLIPIFYAGGYATGTYVGTFISNNVLDSLIRVEVVTKSTKYLKMLKEIRNDNFGVSVIDLKNPVDNTKKNMLIIELNKKRLKELTHIIRKIDPDAFVIIHDTKYTQKGIVR